MPVIKSKGYAITIGNTAFKSLSTFLSKASYTQFFILGDENTLKDCLPVLIIRCPVLAEAQLLEIESGESSKVMEVCTPIWQTLLDHKADKKTLLINLGGGVVSDLGGFVASVYKRGIDFINIPTSLLAMADASVGGKTGIDFGGIKNVIGSFAQPKGVFVYPGFLNTLPKRHYDNGLAEVFKIALVSDKTFWTELSLKNQTSEQLVTKSIALKNKIVLKDPFDDHQRKALNFGHTIGHAIEALSIGSVHELLHGEAILIGMIVESHLSFQKKLITKAIFLQISSRLQSVFVLKSIARLDPGHILEQIRNDKKTRKDEFRFALITKIGGCKTDCSATEAQVKKALLYYNRLVA